MIHPKIAEITARIIERSAPTRQEYLEQIEIKNCMNGWE